MIEGFAKHLTYYVTMCNYVSYDNKLRFPQDSPYLAEDKWLKKYGSSRCARKTHAYILTDSLEGISYEDNPTLLVGPGHIDRHFICKLKGDIFKMRSKE